MDRRLRQIERDAAADRRHESPDAIAAQALASVPAEHDWRTMCEWGASTFSRDCYEPKVEGTRFCAPHGDRIRAAGDRDWE